MSSKQRCTAEAARGRPCRAWAVPGSEPPRWRAHGGSHRPVDALPDTQGGGSQAARHAEPAAAPPGAPDVRRQSFYGRDPAAVTVDDAIAGLVDKMQRLDELIAALPGDGESLIRLLEVYTQASSRLSRLLRDRRALSGDAADGIAGAIGQALDELATELKTDL